MSELKPCPFCGGKSKLSDESVFGYWHSYCIDCRSSSASCSSKDRAIQAWNTRSEPAYLAGYKDGYAVGKCEATFEEPVFHVSPDADGVFDG